MAPRTFVELAANPSLERDMSDAELLVIFSGVTVEAFYPVDGPRTTALLRYHHDDPTTIYQAKVPQNEPGAHDVRVHAKLLHYATVESSISKGELLGVTGRIDSLRISYTAPPLRGHSLLRSIRYERMPNTATFQRSATNGSADGLGQLAKLPRELRAKVYEYAFPQSFWQCYRTKSEGLALLGASHSNSQTPDLFRTSSVIRTECLESVYHGTNKSTIVIGSNVIAFNFPLQAGMVAGQTVDSNNSQIPSAQELFIGVQPPSPRSVGDMALVRSQVKVVTDLINAIAANHRVPPIRVSFETKASGSGQIYHRSDFEILMSPLYKLRLPPINEDLKYRLPLIIERSMHPKQSDIKRIETCNLIESATEHPERDHSRLVYRQLMIDVKLSLAMCSSNVLRARMHIYEVIPLSDAAAKRLAQDVMDLIAWYKSKRIMPPGWLSVLHRASAGETVDMNRVEQLAKQVVGGQTLQSVGGSGSTPVVCTWASGHTSAFNPFFKEGEEGYWD